MARTERETIARLDQLIRLQTGNAKDLAKRLNVCEKTVFNLIDKVKEQYKAPVLFDKYKNTYYYSRPGRIVLEFQSGIIETDDMKKIKGGKLIFIENNLSL